VPPDFSASLSASAFMTTSLGISVHLKCTASSLEGIAALLEGIAALLEGIAAHLEGIAALLEGIAAHLEGIAAHLEGLVRIQSAERSAAALTNWQITIEVSRLEPLMNLFTTEGTLDDALRIGVKPWSIRHNGRHWEPPEFTVSVVVVASAVVASVVVVAAVIASAVEVAVVVA
jgi:hypothetical protein